MRCPRVPARILTRILATTAALALGAGSAVPVSAQETGIDGDSSTSASDLLWTNPEARSADPDSGVTAQVTAQSAVQADRNATVEFTLEVRNSSSSTVSDLELRTQHADPVTEAAAVATSLLANQGEYGWIGEFITLDGTLAPGQTRELQVTVPLGEGDGTGESRGDTVTLPGLNLVNTGVHPLLFNLNGQLEDAGTAYLAGARTTLTVTGDSTDNTDSTDSTEDDSTPAGLTVLWPLSSASVAVAGQVGDAPDPAELYLPDETLAGELGPGGRLRGLLDSYQDALSGPDGTLIHQATCLAVDPDLLETVDRMTDGYRVGSSVPSPVEEPTRLRDSWGRDERDTDSVAGTGKDVAATWLDDLRTITADSCVVPLPYANADINAVASGNDAWLTEELLTRGVTTVEEILEVTPASGIQIPGSGYLDAGTLPVLAGSTGDGDAPVTAVVADSTLTVGAGADGDSTSATATLPDTTVRTLRYPAALGAALAATGTTPETVAYTDLSSRRDLTADGAASRMAAAVGVLDLELDAARSGSGEVLAVPPAAWSVDETDATTFLEAVASHFSDGSATPVSFGDALAAPAGTAELVEGLAEADPAPVDDGEARNIAQIAGHLRSLTEIMDDVPNIALTRRIYTRPMFDDLLRSVTDTGRRNRDLSSAVRAAGAQRTGQVTGLAYALRTSVTLLPPGNVFTRTSDSSPLIVVARNGLPLPVSVRVNYVAAPGVTLNTPGVQQIPAQGSVTLQMTSSIPGDTGQSDLTMYLSTPGDVRISEEVTIRVASVPAIDWRTVGLLLTALVVMVLGVRALRRRRRAVHGSPPDSVLLEDGHRD